MEYGIQFPNAHFGTDGCVAEDAAINSALTRVLFNHLAMDVDPSIGPTVGYGWAAEVVDTHPGELMMEPDSPTGKTAHYAFRAGERVGVQIGTRNLPAHKTIKLANSDQPQTVDLRGRSYVILRRYEDAHSVVADGAGDGIERARGVYKITVWVSEQAPSNIDPRIIAFVLEDAYCKTMGQNFPSYAVLVGKRNYATQPSK